MSYSFKIVGVDRAKGSVQVVYFPSGVSRDAQNNPAWFVGPWNFDLPLDATGQPISGQALLDHLSNLCPGPVIDRESATRAAALNMDAVANLLGTEHAVVQTSPVVVSTAPAAQPVSPVVAV